MQTDSFNPNIPHLLYHLDYRVYSRPFRIPLHTHHGEWSKRQGILLKLSTERGHVSFGEIAPLPWFGSETLDQALDLCQTLGAFPTRADLLSVPNSHPASQFGMESVVESMQTAIAQQPKVAPLAQAIPKRGLTPTPPHCHLLPTGASALTAWQQPWSEGLHGFKWKIGVTHTQEELALFEQLVQALPPTASIRLDANGGLSWAIACQWLELCDQLSPRPGSTTASGYSSAIAPTIEFLEQPLPPDCFEELLALSHRYQTPLALDESVATFNQLEECYAQGWRGIFVIKPAIAGSPSRLRRFCQQHALDIVWSSVLETAIARQFITHHLIPSIPTSTRPLGFGVDQWFEPSPFDQVNAEAIWNSCSA